MAKLMVHRNILKAFHKLPSKVQKRVSALIEEFQHDPQSPAIGMHPLSGTMLDPKVRGVTRLPDGYRAIVIAPERPFLAALDVDVGKRCVLELARCERAVAGGNRGV